MAFKHSEEDRVASRSSLLGAIRQRPIHRETLIAKAKALLLACRCCESWLRLVSRRSAKPQREGLRQGSHARPGRAADEDRADPGEDLAPDQRRHADLRQAEHSVIAGEGRRNRERRGDCSAQDQRANDGEGDLANGERQRGGDDADKQRANDSRAAVERCQAGAQSNKERQGVHSEGEDQPAEEADPEQAENKPDDKHGGGLRDKGCDGRTFLHHHGATKSIASGELGWNPFW